jgi:orotate phosphoribosyltransferase
MEENHALRVMNQVGALITDSHIVYTSGLHGTAYVNKDKIYPHTHQTSQLCEAIAKHFSLRSIGVVIAPAVGGVILSQWVAHCLDIRRAGFDTLGRLPEEEYKIEEVLSVYADKEGDDFVIKRGYEELIPGANVLAVEDVLTTGGSVKKVVEAVRALGGNVVGVGVLCNRGGVKPEDIGGVPEIYALATVNFESYPADDCPLCKQGVPINTSVGKGREFLAGKAT